MFIVSLKRATSTGRRNVIIKRTVRNIETREPHALPRSGSTAMVGDQAGCPVSWQPSHSSMASLSNVGTISTVSIPHFFFHLLLFLFISHRNIVQIEAMSPSTSGFLKDINKYKNTVRF